eukprot:5674006-Ditylum_brightwellii.AAC.1
MDSDANNIVRSNSSSSAEKNASIVTSSSSASIASNNKETTKNNIETRRSESNITNDSSSSAKSKDHGGGGDGDDDENISNPVSDRAESPPIDQIQQDQFAEIDTPPDTPPQAYSPPPMKIFDTLSEAIESNDSTTEQIRSLVISNKYENVTMENRKHLWVKVICGKTLESVRSSSIADSFQEWDEEFSLDNSSSEEDDGDKITKWVKEEADVLAAQMVS